MYKLSARPTKPTALSNAPSAFDDTTLRALYQHMRQGNIATLPLFIRQAEKKSRSPEVVPRVATKLRIEAARALVMLGGLEMAANLLSTALARLPALSSDLLADIKRLRARIYLDQGNVAASRALAEEVDCTEFERGKDSQPLFVRSEAEITTDTWMLLTEVALVDNCLDEARQHFECAVDRLARDEVAYTARLNKQGYAALRIATPESKRHALNVNDARNNLRFLDAIMHIANSQPSGFDMLSVLEERLHESEQIDCSLMARIQAASGAWDGGEQPPVGINVFEARRWQHLATSRALPSASFGDTPLDDLLGISTTTSDVVKAPADPLGINAIPETSVIDGVPVQPSRSISPVEEAQVEAIHQLIRSNASTTSAMLDRLEQLSVSRAPAPSVPPPVPLSDDFAYGGKFKDFDLVSMLCNAEQGKFTGYFHARWKPATIETTVMAGRLHPHARYGEGWVFLRDGLVIDATVGTHDPTLDALADPEDAATMLVLLLQIGLGVGLDNDPDGAARGYRAASVALRTARLPQISKNDSYLMGLVTNREKELGIITGDADVIGDWG